MGPLQERALGFTGVYAGGYCERNVGAAFMRPRFEEFDTESSFASATEDKEDDNIVLYHKDCVASLG